MRPHAAASRRAAFAAVLVRASATARAAIAVRAKMRMGQSAQRCDIAYVIVRVNVRCAYVLVQVVSTEHMEYDCVACVRACR